VKAHWIKESMNVMVLQEAVSKKKKKQKKKKKTHSVDLYIEIDV
jgi:hypothetical protein